MDVETSIFSLNQSKEVLSQVWVHNASDGSGLTPFPEIVENSVTTVILVDQSDGVTSTQPCEILTFIIVT